MKSDLRCSLLAKVVAIFLVVGMGLLGLFSAGGLAIGYEMGFYQEEELAFEDTSLFSGVAESIAHSILECYTEYDEPFLYVSGIGASIRDAGTQEVLFEDIPDQVNHTVAYTFSSAGVYAPQTAHTLPESVSVQLYFDNYDDFGNYDMESAYVFYRTIYPIRSSLPWMAGLSILAFFALLVFLLCAAGHQRGREGITPNWLDRVPLDLYLAAVFFLGALNLFVVMDLNVGGWIQLLLGVLLCIPLFLLGLATLMTLSTRLKLGRFWENTVVWQLGRPLWRLCRRCCRGVATLFHILPFTWRSVLVVGVLLFLQPFLFYWGTWDGFPLLLMLVLDLVVLLCAAFFSWQLQKLKTAGQQLADGDLEIKIDTRGMFWDTRTHAENLNAIGQGMNRAVEQRMKSERLKTELITNVSHDIKTPLTSIVNYVDLLEKEELSGTAQEYVAVLDRQSKRLKKLTEDLVEASKASTGNIAVTLQPLVINEIVHQAVGEYDQKLTAGKLEVIINTFEGNLTAMADSRLLWRVLDNLLSNVCKYALAGSRVYIDLKCREDRVVLSMKNISRDQLNISADELMERFVRGDASRHAEGSGLGLNIAKSLMELMGGTFSLAVDGDLFKAELTLKRAD